jgi:hypothetical protein
MNGQWNFMRLLRGGIALWAFWQVYHTGEWILLIPGVLFGMQAVLNVGCCGSAGCATPPNRTTSQHTDTEPVVYEEVR